MTASGRWRSPLPTSPGAVRAAHPAWFANAVGYGVLLVALVLLMLVDDRLLNGVSVWKKPAKFSLSIAVYLGTLCWFASLVPRSFWQSFEGRAMTWVAIGTAVFEIAYITLMGALGQPSHFNLSTPLTSTMYSLMGFAATLLVAVCPWLAFAIVRHRTDWRRDPVVLGVVAGLTLTFMLGGGFGGHLGSQTGHWVGGTPSDAGGLPLFDWSTDGGDLRVAHFFGMHAMQALPVAALLLARLPSPRLLLAAFAAGYGLWTTHTFFQALDGQPFL